MNCPKSLSPMLCAFAPIREILYSYALKSRHLAEHHVDYT